MKFLINNRKYLGSKTKLLEQYFEIIKPFIKSEFKTFFDMFGGTGIVSSFFQKKNFDISVNDFLISNNCVYSAFFGPESVNDLKIEKYFTKLKYPDKLNNWFTDLYKEKYFSTNDILKISFIREEIEKINNLNTREKNVLLASLIYSCDRAANSMGHYDMFIKRKVEDKFEFKLIDYNSCKPAKIFCENANDLIGKFETDILYLDPPYNSRQYSNLYHILETLVLWEDSQDYTGMALKNNKVIKKSTYSMASAKDSMTELVLKAKSKIIIVSYNDFKTTNSRSESKIKLDDLIEILELRGTVHKYNIPYKMYASNIKKSNQEEYEEILLICEVKTKDISEMNVKYPFNYMGGKFKLIEKIKKALPDNIEVFYDLFAGGGNVGINVNAKEIILNDKNVYQINVLKELYNKSPYEIIKNIEKNIFKYKLGYSKKGFKDWTSDSDYKNKYNDKYLLLREDFNKEKIKDIYKFITLVIYSFNNSINFNLNGGFNIPMGKRDFNKNIYKNLILFSYKMKEKNIKFYNEDYFKVPIDNNPKNVIYLDPPYLITFAHYNKEWNDQNEINLIEFIKSHNNVYLSNTIKNGMKVNKFLLDFLEEEKSKIKKFEIQISYDNSWFHKIEKGNEEIFINYKKNSI